MKRNVFFIKLISVLAISIGLISCNQQKETGGLAAHKENAIAILTAHVQTLNPGYYSNENWLAIEQIANTGKENINMAVSKPEVNTALNTALKEIHMVDYEGRDFVLTIWVEETTWIIGEDFIVDGELKNISGEDQEVVFGIFTPRIPGEDWNVDGGVWEHLKYPPVLLFKSNNIRPLNLSLSHFDKISPGVHQLTVRGGVHLGWVQPVDSDKPISWDDFATAQRIDVSSNTIVLTIK